MKIAEGELHQILIHDLKLPADAVRELVADSRQNGQSLLQTAIESDYATDTQIAQAHAKRLGVPFIDLTQTPIAAKTITRLPRQIAGRYHVVCFDETLTSIKLAMSDPRDERARQAVRDYSHKTVRRYLATEAGLAHALRAYSKTTDAPLPLSTRELLATILEQALRNGSRDIHFEPQGTELLIRRRVGKRLQTMSTLPLERARSLVSWCKVQTHNDVGDTERAHHGRFSIRIDGVLHDVIMSTIPVIDGEKMVLRLIPPSHSVPSLEAIGYGPKARQDLADLITDGRGLVIIAGDKDAEVATTLASMTKITANQPHVTVTSIEQPLTYQIPNSNQIEVTHALPFADIVSTVITQSPNVIVTSQLGKAGAAEQLVDFSLSQHLVISGLHATTMSSAVTHLMKYPMAPALMAASLRLIVVQHQVDALCSTCRISFKPVGPLRKALSEQFGFDNDANLYRQGLGCHKCERGIHGSVMVAEWLPVTRELQQLLATKADQQTLTTYLEKHNNIAKQLGKLASKGIISVDEATRQVA